MQYSRRSFLQAAALALGATAVGACDPASRKRKDVLARPLLHVALVGCGRQGIVDLRNLLSVGVNLIALCDVDERQIAGAAQELGANGAETRRYIDYRHMLDAEKTLEAVVIATPDHWHAPLCKAFMLAGKHIYCEKPLTHAIGEARELRTLSRSSNVVTQMGNQGSASRSFRRCVELIRAGALGQVRDIHVWIGGGTWPHDMERPRNADPVPPGLNWNFWIGPAAFRPYKATLYHPYNWRGWYDFGTGQPGNFGCHALNLPVRALDLGPPDRVELLSPPGNKECYARSNHLIYHFAARGAREPVAVHWYDGTLQPPADVVADVTRLYHGPKAEGVLIIGQKGIMFTDPWGKGGLIKLRGEERLTDVMHHPATSGIPQTLPRVDSHAQEWLDACRGGPKTFSDFDTAGLLSEIVLTGVLAQRLGRTIEWHGANMQVKGAPEA